MPIFEVKLWIDGAGTHSRVVLADHLFDAVTKAREDLTKNYTVRQLKMDDLVEESIIPPACKGCDMKRGK